MKGFLVSIEHTRTADFDVDSVRCHILIVDDDPDCLKEYCESTRSLGYQCHAADGALTALQLVAGNHHIGIVMTDIRMPEMSGLLLIEELSERFMGSRPLVALAITGVSTLEAAISAMRAQAVDFLEKPITQIGLAGALQRATAKWTRLAAQFRLLSMADVSHSRRVARAGDADPQTGIQPSNADLQALVQALLKARQRRSKFFDPAILTGSGWSILMDLTAARLQGAAVPISSACASTELPLSTALRHVNQMVAAGLIKREPDPNDKRRSLLELEPETFDLMTRYLASSFEGLAPTFDRDAPEAC
jgi:FixJ family two-component response regulator/DNA-binding MarR family transcriptional regulator